MKNAESPSHNVNDDLNKHYFSGLDPKYWTKYKIPKEALNKQ